MSLRKPVRSTLLLDEIASPLGRIVIAAREGRLCALEFGRERMSRQLAARYPDAKVLLSLRDARRWHESVMNTIQPVLAQGPPEDAPALLHEFHAFVRELIVERTFGGRLADRAHATRVFEAHNRAVIDAIPAARLLVYRPGDGWEPLCRFLDVPVPDGDFPRLNDTAWYRSHAGLPALEGPR